MVIFTVIAGVVLGNKAASYKIPSQRYTHGHEGARGDPARRVLRARPPAPRRRLAGGVSRARGLRTGGDGHLRRAIRRRARPAGKARRDLRPDSPGAPPSRCRPPAAPDPEHTPSPRP